MPMKPHHLFSLRSARREQPGEATGQGRGARSLQRLLLIGVIALACAVAGAAGTVEISHLPDSLDAEYDLTWMMCPAAAVGTLDLLVEDDGHGNGYQFTLSAGQASWRHVGTANTPPLAIHPLSLHPGRSYAVTLKRRAGVMAFLLDHRLVFAAPMAVRRGQTIAFRQVSPTWSLTNVRYHIVGPRQFGDDFMRPEALDQFFAAQGAWVDDPTWLLAGLQGLDWPGGGDLTGLPPRNPWQLSLLPYSETSANGFWFIYTGKGPSWVVANPTMVYPSWDRYYAAVSVRPDVRSAVGVLAAYQDNRNYLLFRWSPGDYASDQPKGVLTAMIDGTPRVLGTTMTGFVPGQWYRIRLNLGWHTAEVLVDDQRLIAGENPGPIEGRVGLYAENNTAGQRHLVADSTTGALYLVAVGVTSEMLGQGYEVLPYPRGVFFDDIQIGDWPTVEDLTAESALSLRQGSWTRRDGEMCSETSGRLIGGAPEWAHYRLTTQVTLPPAGEAGVLFHLDGQLRGYAWLITEHGYALHRLQYGIPQEALVGAGHPLRQSRIQLVVEVDGPYVALYCDGRRVLDYYDAARRAGQCGVMACSGGVRFTPVRVEPLADRDRSRPVIHQRFIGDRWLSTWSSSEADWSPAHPPNTVSGLGAAAPLPTDQPGRYWHKGGHYHELRVCVPITPTVLTGQTIHLTAQQEAEQGYRLRLTTRDGRGLVELFRRDTLVTEKTFPITARAQLTLQRRGSYLILSVQQLDADTEEPDVLDDELVLTYQDPAPLLVQQVGFTVTTPDLPAVAVQITSDRVMETFEAAPVCWGAGSGVWGVTERYACKPNWNWYGGFGPGMPVAWSKQRLLGNQSVEAYFGVKMLYPGVKETYPEQFRDLNLSICADGVNPLSGYSLVRGTLYNGVKVTQLLRNGVVVQSSTAKEHLFPPETQGHRQWFATRLEKHGAILRVYIDNRPAMTYTDPEPLSGGHIACWTCDNGIMVGRVNYSAEATAPGAPALVSFVDLLDLPATSITVPLAACRSFGQRDDGHVDAVLRRKDTE